MSKESALAFMGRTGTDGALRDRVAALGPDDAAGLVQIAASAGFPLTLDDLKGLLAAAGSGGDLGAEELEQVSGGLNPQPLPPRELRAFLRINPGMARLLSRGIIIVSG